MKARIAMLLSLALLGPLPVAAQSQEELLDKIDAHAPPGYDLEKVEPKRKSFPSGGKDANHDFRLEPGYEYVFLAVCGDECKETPPSISVPDGDDEDDQWGRSEAGGVYRIKSQDRAVSVLVRVGLPKCSKGRCYYAIAVFKKEAAASTRSPRRHN